VEDKEVMHHNFSGFYDSQNFDIPIEQLLKAGDDISFLLSELDKAKTLIAKSQHEVFVRLAIAAEYKDESSTLHLSRIGFLSEKLCSLLGEPENYCFMMRLAAPMHDVGKIGIPDSILKKEGPLSTDERVVMNTHSIIGERILNNTNVEIFKLASKIAISHHEKYDGTGYPYGLKGKHIPFPGRVVSIVDFFDALTMDRCYRPAVKDEIVYGMMRSNCGNHFDPELAEVFLSNFDQFILLREKINTLNLNYENIFSTVI
jgi:putative two-component system response regulator